MKLSEASPPHPWNPELPRFSQAVDHLPAIWVCGINSGPVYPFPFRYLGARVTPSRSLQSSPCYHRQGLVACTCGGGRMSVPRAGATRLDVENKKAVKTNPGGTTPSCEECAPHSGSEFDLTAFMLGVPRLRIWLDCAMKSQQMSTTLMEE
jgi:hypothetical protein